MSVTDPRIIYELDSDDIIVASSGDWSDVVDDVRDRPLREFISGVGVQDLYERLIKRVRTGHTVAMDYRCDSPTHQRFMQLVVGPLPRGHVRFDSRVLVEVARSSDAVARPPSEGAILRCSVCNAVYVRKRWEPEDDPDSAYACMSGDSPKGWVHGLCPPCLIYARTRLCVDPTADDLPWVVSTSRVYPPAGVRAPQPAHVPALQSVERRALQPARVHLGFASDS